LQTALLNDSVTCFVTPFHMGTSIMVKISTITFAGRANLLATSARRSLAVLAIIAGVPAAQAAQIITVGPNVNVSKLLGNQSETSIAVNRLNTDLISIGANNLGAGPDLFLAYSNNGGTTWNTSSFNPAACCDTWMGADSFGNMYLSYLTGGITTNIARSIDGGASYTNIGTIAGSSDHPELAVGPGTVAGTDSIFLRDSTGSGNRVISGTSTGLGITSPFTTQTGLGGGNFGSTAVGPGGRTAFTSMSPAGGIGPTTMTIRYDADGTGPGGYVTQSSITTNVGGFRPIPAQPSRTIDAQVDLEYDFSGGAYNGSLYMLYTQAANTTTNDTNIVFRKSTDNGATFSSEIKLNDDVSTMSQFFGRLAVDQKTGWLASVWYDARNSVSNNTVELWGSFSFDGGLSWASNFKISDGVTSCLAATIGGDGNECGDYISLDFYDGKLVTAWADSSNSTGNNPNGRAGLEVYFSKVTVTNAVAAVPEPTTWAFMILGFGLVGAQMRRSTAVKLSNAAR
jgi:PEP-CTERM motif